MKAAIYIRVSTEDQNTDMQRVSLIRYCETHGLSYTIYEDKLSGTNTDRPELQRMMADIKQQKYEKLIVWKLDRFSRSVADLIKLLTEVNESDCGFVSLHESIDMSTAVGRMMFHMMAAFAQFTADTIRENVTAGLAAKKARGERLGPEPVYLDMEEIRRLRSEGLPVVDIARRVGMSKSQLYRRLSSG